MTEHVDDEISRNDSFSFVTIKGFVIEGANFKILPNTRSNKLIILFSGTYKNNGRFDFWRVAHALQECSNVLLLNNGRNEWYQRGIPDFGASLESSVNHIKALANTLGAKEIYTVGVSMGGFGAVLMGIRLRARVLAFGIDSLLRVQGSRSLKSMSDATVVAYPDLRPLLKTSRLRISLIVGEMDVLDLYGASRLVGLKNVRTMSVRGMGHGGGRYFEKTVGLAGMLKRFMFEGSLPQVIEAGTALKTPELVTTLYKAHCLGLDGHWEQSALLLSDIIKKYPMSETARYLLGLSLIQLKQYEAARHQFCFVAAMTPYFTSGRFYLAYCLRKEKQYSAALHLLLQLLKETPESAPTHFNIGLIHLAQKNRVEAIAAVSRAVEIKPDRKIYSAKLSELIEG